MKDLTPVKIKPQVVASECAAAHFPQNTLAGFRFCLASAVDGIEFDVHLARDGQVVVQHDYTLNKRITRTADGEFLPHTGPAVKSLTLAELRQYDVGRYRAGSREAAEYSRYQPLDGERIPALVEFLDACAQSDHRPILWIELKTSPFQRDTSSDPHQLLDAVLKLVGDYEMAANTVLLAFEWNLLQQAKALCPEIQTDYLTINPKLVQALSKDDVNPALLYGAFDPAAFGGSTLKAIVAAGGDWWGPLVSDVGATDVAEAHDLGLKVNIWGVESNLEGVDRALALNADAITLSDPIMLAERLSA